MNGRLLFDFPIIQIDWTLLHSNSDEKYKKLILDLTKSELPFKITNSQVYSLTNTYEDVKKLIRAQNVNVSASQDQTYSGLAEKHIQLEMNLVDYFSTSEETKILDDIENKFLPQLSLYLSQYNLLDTWDKEELSNIISFKPLEKLINDNFSRINIWHSFSNTYSKFHYDSYDNFLLVIKGCKKVILLPNNTKFILAHQQGENSSNQCKKVRYKKFTSQLNELKTKLNQISFSINNVNTDLVCLVENYKSYLKTVTKYFFPNVEIKQGEILYIPEAWWHHVSTEVSQIETINCGQSNNIFLDNDTKNIKNLNCESFALNFWWEKTNRLINNGKEIFLIKKSIESLLEKKINREYLKIRKFYRKYTVAYFRRLLKRENCGEILISHLFEKDDINIWLVIYSEFERHHSDKEFFSIFWTKLNENISEQDYSLKFMKKIEEMKRSLTADVIKYIQNIYKINL